MPASGTTPAPVRLLLIDDETVFVEVLAKRLARRGIKVAKAFSGEQGIRLLRKHDFDAALLDLKMVDMDGLEVLKILKIVDPGLPVILVSGHGADDAARRGMEGGAFDFLAKPCDLELLLEKIGSAVQQRGIPLPR